MTTDHSRLAQLLFGHLNKTPSDYLTQYPKRQLPQGARVTRFAPSPTGFLHIGGLFAAYISQLTARASGGIFYLRVEDTDKKREMEEGVREIIEGLKAFGIHPDEGVTGAGQETGDYGPYLQSRRKDIYQAFAKQLVEQGMAYPCFCTSKKLEETRRQQEEQKRCTGYYGQWATCRDISDEEAAERVDAGEPYVLRLRSPGEQDKRIAVEDMIKGKMDLPENTQDVVLLKTDGIPTYHFAHVVDDFLMGTTHVIRGDEWISSLPLHIQLFRVLGLTPPKYAHISPIMKEENGGKRKLSKRKDPEAAVSYYNEEGYPKASVQEYLLTLANSNFEDWRRANQRAPLDDFPFLLKKMSQSGALFDLAKLNDVSKNVISLLSAEEVFQLTLEWAKQYDAELFRLFSQDPFYAKEILSIDREGAKPRKDLAKWKDVKPYVSYLYDSLFVRQDPLPERISREDASAILEAYLAVYDEQADKDSWFAGIKGLCEPLGFTPNIKDYKKTPELFKGHAGDVSSVIRIAVTGRQNTPDLWAILRLLGKEKVLSRIREFQETVLR